MKTIKIFSPQDFPAYLPKLNALYDELFSGGKGFRSKLIQIISEPLRLDASSVHLLCQTIEFIHNASLLHDDLIDGSPLRRGKTAAWKKYTPEYSVLAGDYLLARVMVNLSSFGNLKLVQYTSETISELLEGEWLQDSLVEDWGVSLEQLDRVHKLKTGSLFKWCFKAPFMAQENYDSKTHELLSELASIIGVLFQRSDDLLDFDIRNHENKAVMGDLQSGYLNSFAAFLFNGSFSAFELKEAFSHGDFNDLESLKNRVGESQFSDAVLRFDNMNQDLIDQYNHQLYQLELLLKPDEKVICESFKSLPNLLYWRKKS